jgi:hypothetical protein
MVESRLDVGGGVVVWSLADWTDRLRLTAAFRSLGLGSFVPEPRPPSAALKDALENVLGGPRVLVRPLATRDGFAVVTEDRGLAQNQYATALTAKVTGEPPGLSFDPWDSRAVGVEDAFRAQLGRVSGNQLSAALVKVIDFLGGTRLRPSGAVYWLPGHRLAPWTDVAHAVEQSAEGRPSAVYVLRHRLDADAVRAVRDAVVAEVQAEAIRIREEVLAGDLGGRALETRKRHAADLRDKVLLYEDLLDVGLKGLHAALDEADQAAATAVLLLSSTAPEAGPVLAGAR